MSLQVKQIASGQGVGSSAGVAMDTTPFMTKHSVLCRLEGTGDRVVQLEKSDDGGSTWSNVGSSVTGTVSWFEVVAGEQHRITVSGGASGVGNCDFIA
ncbi:MAG TPA: hypothetical protein ENJ18_10585 [Nannocystis exedens]|nr:hypothetical protein [Nannocystis exedens]